NHENKPAMKLPARPTRIVPPIPMGSGPRSSRRASAPTTSPLTASRMRNKTSDTAALSLPADGDGQTQALAPTHRVFWAAGAHGGGYAAGGDCRGLVGSAFCQMQARARGRDAGDPRPPLRRRGRAPSERGGSALEDLHALSQLAAARQVRLGDVALDCV